MLKFVDLYFELCIIAWCINVVTIVMMVLIPPVRRWIVRKSCNFGKHISEDMCEIIEDILGMNLDGFTKKPEKENNSERVYIVTRKDKEFIFSEQELAEKCAERLREIHPEEAEFISIRKNFLRKNYN